MIIDPFGEAARYASIVREFYEAFRKEGFSRREALTLTLAAMGQRDGGA